jgi:hypothetical protein
MYTYSQLSTSAKKTAIKSVQIYLNEKDAKGRIYTQKEAKEAIIEYNYTFNKDGKFT